MKLTLQQKQMLKMVMTTELRQAIELLQLSTYELLQFIQEEAEENPLIELVEKNNEMSIGEIRPMRRSSELDPIDFAKKSEKTMHEYLLEQIIHLPLSEQEYELVHYLILNINEQGYLAMSDEEVFEQREVNEAQLNHAKSIVHRLEPRGIGARNVAECLSIQAKEKYPHDVILHTVLDEYLDLIAHKQWKKLAKELNLSLPQVKEIFDRIQTLNPRPASNFAHTHIDYVQADILIEKNEEDDSYFVQLNDYYIPKVTFNERYSNELNQSKELSQYVQKNYKKYEWMIKSIEQRRTTILKIMKVIINRQHDFFQKGLRALKPLTLKDVADEIGMHESTVSRATMNKVIETPVGIYELRHLFSTKLASKSGDDTSQTKVKTMLKEMILAENKYKPLSDQKLADYLKEESGIVISRRTVAKYRDELQIPSSSKRKELKIN